MSTAHRSRQRFRLRLDLIKLFDGELVEDFRQRNEELPFAMFVLVVSVEVKRMANRPVTKTMWDVDVNDFAVGKFALLDQIEIGELVFHALGEQKEMSRRILNTTSAAK